MLGGIVSLVAGSYNVAAVGHDGDGGPAISATLSNLGGLATDTSGSLYVADNFYCLIRKISAAGIITTIAGTGTCGATSGDGGAAALGQMAGPQGLAVSSSGNVYIADDTGGLAASNKNVRKLTYKADPSPPPSPSPSPPPSPAPPPAPRPPPAVGQPHEFHIGRNKLDFRWVASLGPA